MLSTPALRVTNDALTTTISTLSAQPDVKAIGLGGSRATDRHDAGSDHDIYVFTENGPVPTSVRRELAMRYDPAPEIANMYWGEGDYWYADGIGLDIMFMEADWFDEEVRAPIEQHRARDGYSTSFWFTTRNMTIVFDRDGWLQDLVDIANMPYPDATARAIITYHRPLVRGLHTSYRNQIARAIEIDDPLSINHRVAALLQSVTDIAFAALREPHPGEKRQLAALDRNAERLPAEFTEHIRAVLASVTQPDALLPAVDRLCDDVDIIDLT